ncbi:MAG: polysaccharide deacetylase family protein [Clostridiaceae bacterium]|nr:polysaccharide deacetylase family protein [Clostridiaceae bacterium]
MKDKNKLELSTALWKYGKDWVYSITYDEALSDLYKYVIPTHDRLGIPGHVEVVSGHIGKIRNLGASSFNGMKHMDRDELLDVMSRGWGVGCHSWSHVMVMQNPERELLQAKKELERVIGRRVTIYTAPGNNHNLTPEVINKAKEYGYIAGMSITDDLNYPDAGDLFWINRVPLHERMSDVYHSTFDAYRRIHQARKYKGWIIDYAHCPLEKAVHDYKDCTDEHHRERLETVVDEGKYDCWFANPDDVVDYRYLRKHAKIIECPGTWGKYKIIIEGLPEQVICREMTFVLKCAYTPEALIISVDGKIVSAFPAGGLSIQGSCICFTAPVKDGSEIVIRRKADRE